MQKMTRQTGEALIEAGIAWGVGSDFSANETHRLIARGEDGTELYYNANPTTQKDIFGNDLPAIFLSVKFRPRKQQK